MLPLSFLQIGCGMCWGVTQLTGSHFSRKLKTEIEEKDARGESDLTFNPSSAVCHPTESAVSFSCTVQISWERNGARYTYNYNLWCCRYGKVQYACTVQCIRMPILSITDLTFSPYTVPTAPSI